MLTAGTVFAAVRELIDDPAADYAADERIAPMVQMAQESLIAKMFANPNIGRAKAIVIVPNVPANTTDLSSYFVDGGALELLQTIESLKERQAGAGDQDFIGMTQVNDLPAVAQTTFNGVYIFTGETVLVPGATQALDLRFFGEFDPKPIVKAEDPILPNASLILKFGAAALLAQAHGNQQLADKYEAKAMEFTNLWMSNLIMEMQGQSTRMKSFGGGSPYSAW